MLPHRRNHSSKILFSFILILIVKNFYLYFPVTNLWFLRNISLSTSALLNSKKYWNSILSKSKFILFSCFSIWAYQYFISFFHFFHFSIFFIFILLFFNFSWIPFQSDGFLVWSTCCWRIHWQSSYQWFRPYGQRIWWDNVRTFKCMMLFELKRW